MPALLLDVADQLGEAALHLLHRTKQRATPAPMIRQRMGQIARGHLLGRGPGQRRLTTQGLKYAALDPVAQP